MNLKLIGTALAITAVGLAQAQEFAAASLKPSAPNNLGGGYSLALSPGGRLRGLNLSLQILIQIAYDLKQKDQVKPALGWLDSHWFDSQRYDLEATAGAPVGEPQAR